MHDEDAVTSASGFTQGGASEWRVLSHGSFENLKLLEISKNNFNTT